MALPSLKTIQDCGDYAKVVEPFLPQLYELPGKLAERITNPEALFYLYKDTNPLVSGFAFSVFAAAVFLVVSEANRNYSQVDRMWSLLPTMYNAHYLVWAHVNNLPTERLAAVLAWSIVWSARLTFNYWRKGGYSIGSEDYRWEIVRAHIHPILFFILNVTFICFIQSVLLFAIAAPTYGILLASRYEQHLTPADYAFTAIQLGLVLIEFISDGQQWVFQNAKKRYQKTAKLPQGFEQKDLDRGFITSGLWAYCRHPNFTAEQTIWFVLYQWSCFSCNVLYNWSAAGALSLMLLFQGSTWLTELLTANKYPDYKHYQQQVGMQIPNLTPYEPRDSKVIGTSELAKQQKAKQK